MFKKLMIIVIGGLAIASQGVAEERIALVIGNDRYAAIADLPDVEKDAQVVVEGLETLGFDVNFVRNANLRYSRYSLDQHMRRMQNADAGAIGFVYYMGHGVSLNDTNYLLPADINLDNADAIADSAIDAASLIVALPAAEKKQSLVVLDCCVSNPFAQSLGVTGQGLAVMSAQEGNLIAFAAPPGAVVSADNTFAETLMNAIGTPGVSFQEALAQISNAQPIFVSTPISDPIILVAGEATAAAGTTQDTTPQDQAELAWATAQNSKASADVMAFLEAYPDSQYTADAKGLLLSILAAELEVDAPTPTPQDETPAEVIAPTIVEPEPAPVEDPVVADGAPVTFSAPLTQGAPEIVGKTIAQLIEGSPLYPPVEGLPESYWATEECSSCHQWEQANLCTQANSYLSVAGAESLTKQHPYGGTFKQNLRNWAEGGCQ